MDTSKGRFHSLQVSESSSSLSTSFDEEHTSNDDLLFPTTKPSHNRFLAAATRLVIIVLAIWGFLSLLVTLTHNIKATTSDIDIYRPATFPKAYNHCDCGSTITEALSKGCKYDSMGAAWLPEYCRDEELTATFEKSGTEPDNSWPYYADSNGTQRISIEQIAALGRGSFYATRYWHVTHCLFYWEK